MFLILSNSSTQKSKNRLKSEWKIVQLFSTSYISKDNTTSLDFDKKKIATSLDFDFKKKILRDSNV